MDKLYFKSDDKLNRFNYAKFLEIIICNSEDYKKENDGGSYVIGIDSAWGTGKTYFFNMFENYLCGHDESDQKTFDNYKDIHCVIKYNAWENDFWDNAFEPLMFSICNSGIFDNNIDSNNLKDVAIGFGKSLVEVVKGVTLMPIRAVAGDNAIETINKDVIENYKNYLTYDIGIFKEYKEFKENIIKFKKYLKEYINSVSKDKKLIIIIDELDRCKPTFAVNTLEIVKHLFDIDKLVFIFAVDLEQLSHSIKCVYGNIDSTGYLLRFFDYISRIPKPDLKSYIGNKINSIECYDKEDLVVKNFKDRIFNFVLDLTELFNLSLRDLDIILQSYKIMCDVFLNKYYIVGAHYIFLFFLILKYKRVKDFNKLFLKNNNSMFKEKNDIVNYMNGNPWLKQVLINFNNNKMCDYYINPFCNENGDMQKDSFTSDVRIIRIENGKAVIGSRPNGASYQCDINDNGSYGNILFKPDIYDWENIKNLSYIEFLHNKLEMFNFVDLETISE